MTSPSKNEPTPTTTTTAVATVETTAEQRQRFGRDRPTGDGFLNELFAIEAILDSLERIRADFPKWGEKYVKGPGLYFALVRNDSVDGFAHPIGDNRWPVERCRNVFDDLDRFYETATEVAHHRDGAVVVRTDGTVRETMVRFQSLDDERRRRDRRVPEYADWMGTRHMSAVETSSRDGVVATLTLSEESGRVTVFRDGRALESRRNLDATAGGPRKSAPKSQPVLDRLEHYLGPHEVVLANRICFD